MAKNLSVNTWRSGPDICSLICELESYQINACIYFIFHKIQLQKIDTMGIRTCTNVLCKLQWNLPMDQSTFSFLQIGSTFLESK